MGRNMQGDGQYRVGVFAARIARGTTTFALGFAVSCLWLYVVAAQQDPPDPPPGPSVRIHATPGGSNYAGRIYVSEAVDVEVEVNMVAVVTYPSGVNEECRDSSKIKYEWKLLPDWKKDGQAMQGDPPGQLYRQIAPPRDDFASYQHTFAACGRYEVFVKVTATYDPNMATECDERWTAEDTICIVLDIIQESDWEVEDVAGGQTLSLPDASTALGAVINDIASQLMIDELSITVNKKETRDCCNGREETREYGAGQVSVTGAEFPVPYAAVRVPEMRRTVRGKVLTVKLNVDVDLGVFASLDNLDLAIDKAGKHTDCSGQTCDFFVLSAVVEPNVKLKATARGGVEIELWDVTFGDDNIGNANVEGQVARKTLSLRASFNESYCGDGLEGVGRLIIDGGLSIKVQFEFLGEMISEEFSFLDINVDWIVFDYDD